jgi:Holliday junction resolvase RusA-like endonuclease
MLTVLTEEKQKIATQLWASGDISVTEIAKTIGVSQPTMSNWFNKQPWYVPKKQMAGAAARIPKKKEQRPDPVAANKDGRKNFFVIPDTLPGMNDYISALDHSKYIGARLKKTTEEYILTCIMAGLGKRQPFDVKLQIHIRFVERDRRRDFDNITSGTKFILDALRKAGVIYNDGQSYLLPSTFEYDVDKDYPRVEVTINPTEEKIPYTYKKTAVHKANKLRYMSDGEIIRDYNAAQNKDEQIKILAQLNAMSKAEIIKIVGGGK